MSKYSFVKYPVHSPSMYSQDETSFSFKRIKILDYIFLNKIRKKLCKILDRCIQEKKKKQQEFFFKLITTNSNYFALFDRRVIEW